MGKRGRGREGMVRCEKCGRTTRRDKALFIDKPMFTNPLERHQVEEPDAYRRAIFREVCYCVSCGKHGRIFEKKKRMMERQRERERERQVHGGRRPYYGDRRGYGPRPHQAPGQPASAAPQPAEAQAAKAEPAAEQAEASPEESEVPEEAQEKQAQ